MADTRYDSLLAAVTYEENLQAELIPHAPEDEALEKRVYASSDRALNAAELAQAEQLRIANLLTVANMRTLSWQDEDTGNLVSLGSQELRASALKEALTSLGLIS